MNDIYNFNIYESAVKIWENSPIVYSCILLPSLDPHPVFCGFAKYMWQKSGSFSKFKSEVWLTLFNKVARPRIHALQLLWPMRAKNVQNIRWAMNFQVAPLRFPFWHKTAQQDDIFQVQLDNLGLQPVFPWFCLQQTAWHGIQLNWQMAEY